MTSGTPQEKAQDLFNKIVHVQLEDVELAREFADQLQTLNRQRPGDLKTKIAFAEALLLTCRRREAIDQIGGVYSLRGNGSYAELDRLALLLYFTADRTRALEVVEEYAFQPHLYNSGIIGDNAVLISAWAGDIDLLRRLTKRRELPHFEGAADFFLAALTNVGNIEAYQKHQSILIEAVKDVQVAASFAPTPDPDGDWLLINTVFFDKSAITRRALEDRVAKAIEHEIGDTLEGLVSNIFTASPGSPTANIRFLSTVG